MDFFLPKKGGETMCQVINDYEIVGRFLRPEKLKQAREAFAEGKITRSELK